MDTASPIIPQRGTPMWQRPSECLSPAETHRARRLGFGLGALVAVGWEAVSLTALAMCGHWETDDTDPSGSIVFAVACLIPIAAGASTGWCLGPRATLARRDDQAITVIVMAIFTMLLGDALVATTIGFIGTVVGAGTAVEYIPLGVIYTFGIGAVVLGPLVVVFATLPASIVWLVLFRAQWRSAPLPSTGDVQR